MRLEMNLPHLTIIYSPFASRWTEGAAPFRHEVIADVDDARAT